MTRMFALLALIMTGAWLSPAGAQTQDARASGDKPLVIMVSYGG